MPWTELADLWRTDDMTGEPDPAQETPLARRVRVMTALIRARKIRAKRHSKPKERPADDHGRRVYHEPAAEPRDQP